jgi:hypothetical protein
MRLRKRSDFGVASTCSSHLEAIGGFAADNGVTSQILHRQVSCIRQSKQCDECRDRIEDTWDTRPVSFITVPVKTSRLPH